MNEQIDPQAKALVQSIKRQETGGHSDPYNASGKSGEFGAYQFMPDTYKAWAKKYVGDENAAPTVENQNRIAYGRVKEWKDQGLNPAQIAAAWNAGEGSLKNDAWKSNVGINDKGVAYDTPSYVRNVSQYYQQYKQQSGIQHPPAQQPETPTKEPGVWFQSKPGDTALEAGLKTAGNILPSAYEFGKGALNALNPINTIKTLAEIPGAFKEAVSANGGVLPTLARTATSLPSEAVKTVVPLGIRQLATGDIAGAEKSFVENPVGTVAPAVLGVRGAAGAMDAASKARVADYVKNINPEIAKQPIPRVTNYGGAMDRAVSNVAQTAMAPVQAATGAVTGGLGTMTRSLASQLTSLAPETISQILSSPESFSKIAQEQTTRGGLAGEVNSAITSRQADLRENGKGYDAIRQSDKTIPMVKGLIKDTLAEYGITLKNGKVSAGTKSVTRNQQDLNAIQKFYNDWGSKKTLTPHEFLNMREDLTGLSKFDKVTGTGKTRASETVAKTLRNKINTEIRDTNLPELKKLDETYGPETEFLKRVQRDYFNRDGTFKDNAVSKIANAGNKSELLSRLENIMPGITQRLAILKAVEDIQSAYGQKVGTYTRGVLQGTSLLSGNVPALVATIMTHPSNAVKILRTAGYTADKIGPIVEVLKMIGGEINKSPEKATGLLQNLLEAKSSAL